MARPIKKGLSYYSTDTDRYSDIKMKRLRKDFSCIGIAVWDYVLNEIYRVEGSFLLWDEHTAFDVADYFNIKESTVNEVINYCCAVGLFNKELYTSEKILTSKAIQTRFVKICKDSKRASINLPKKVDLINFYELTTEETNKTPEETNKTPSEVHKEKNSIVKNNKEDEKTLTDLIIDEMAIHASKCIKDRRWIETTCMSVGLNPKDAKEDNIRKRLWNFCKHLGSTENKHTTLKDFKSHFVSWLRIQVSLEKKQTKVPTDAVDAEWLA